MQFTNGVSKKIQFELIRALLWSGIARRRGLLSDSDLVYKKWWERIRRGKAGQFQGLCFLRIEACRFHLDGFKMRIWREQSESVWLNALSSQKNVGSFGEECRVVCRVMCWVMLGHVKARLGGEEWRLVCRLMLWLHSHTKETYMSDEKNMRSYASLFIMEKNISSYACVNIGLFFVSM